ncbi:hypothetical protein I317_00437 [Kwoniella heveanensis CBS 569]|nr:hypothetical protein I317_00437 [Kwoniella heveanensis CBS 569]
MRPSRMRRRNRDTPTSVAPSVDRIRSTVHSGQTSSIDTAGRTSLRPLEAAQLGPVEPGQAQHAPSSTGVGGTVSGFQSRLKRCLGYDSALDKETKQKTHRECKLDIMVDEHDPVNICSGHQENLSICKEYVETRTPSTSDWLTRGVAAFKTAQEDASRQRQDLAKMRRSDPSFVPTSSPASLVWRSSTRISDRRPEHVASTQESTLAPSEEGMVECSTSESHIQESETSAMVTSQPASAPCATVDKASSVPLYSEYSLGYDYVRGPEEYFDEEFETIQAARGE